MDKEKKFVHHASVVQGLLGYREHPKYMLVVMIDRMRRHALNIAAELVAQGRLDVVNDIFWLNIKQVTEAQKNPDMELQPLIRANMEPVQMVKHVKNWPKLIDSRGKIIRGEKIDNDNLEEGTLLGDPIAPGTVVGPAKVLMSPYEKPVMSGEILVARFTEPSWTPLFINAVGVVLEIGGPMQHGAIIAREYGIPCVSGIDNATKVIKDGDLLEIDGSSGIVRVIGENDNKST
jgi:pyruvate,water dikinase